MNEQKPHIVQSQVFEIELTDGDNPSAVEALFIQVGHNWLPGMERVLSDVGSQQNCYRIDRLILDLGRIPENCPADDLISRMNIALETELKALLGNKPDHTVYEHRAHWADSSPLPGRNDISVRSKERVSVTSLAADAEQIFLFYLSNGYLPWYADTSFKTAWNQYVESVFSAPSAEFAAELRGLLEKNVPARVRLAYQFFGSIFPSILRLLYSVQSPKPKHIDSDRASFKEMDGVLNQMLQAPRLDPIARYLLLEAVLWPSVRRMAETMAVVFKNDPIAPDELLHAPQAEKETADRSRESALSGDLLKRYLPSGDFAASEDQELSLPASEYLYVDFAGLVLLHPFLSGLFNALGLTDGDHKFADIAQQTKAVFVLGYLAGAKTEWTETELTFCKLLSGLPLHWPLPADFVLLPREKEACDEMLMALIRHWKVLGNTSPDGLRVNFLWRRGRVNPAETPMTVWVEQNSVDVLLENLPWGISFLKLPWLEKYFSIVWH